MMMQDNSAELKERGVMQGDDGGLKDEGMHNDSAELKERASDARPWRKAKGGRE
jgi:hypothetical protein